MKKGLVYHFHNHIVVDVSCAPRRVFIWRPSSWSNQYKIKIMPQIAISRGKKWHTNQSKMDYKSTISKSSHHYLISVIKIDKRSFNIFFFIKTHIPVACGHAAIIFEFSFLFTSTFFIKFYYINKFSCVFVDFPVNFHCKEVKS